MRTLQLSALLALLVPALAYAQTRRTRRVVVSQANTVTELTQATAQLRSFLEQGRRRRGPLYASAVELERRAQEMARCGRRGRRGRCARANAAFNEQYVAMRRAIFSARAGEPLLDTWDQVVAAAQPHRRATPGPVVHQVQQPPVVQHPVRPGGSYTFSGTFERNQIQFSAPTLDGLVQQCDSFVRGAGLSHVDDIQIFGTRARNRSGYWNAQALCGIVAINARTNVGGAQVTGTIEDLPFSISASHPGEVRRIATRWIPVALAGQRYIDDLTIQGRRHRNRSGYWSAQQVVQMITSQIPAGVTTAGYTNPVVGQPVMVVATGDVEGSPFSFQAPNPQQLQVQCVSFVSALGNRYIDDVTVNGQPYHNGPGYWDANAVCGIIVSQAR